MRTTQVERLAGHEVGDEKKALISPRGTSAIQLIAFAKEEDAAKRMSDAVVNAFNKYAPLLAVMRSQEQVMDATLKAFNMHDQDQVTVIPGLADVTVGYVVDARAAANSPVAPLSQHPREEKKGEAKQQEQKEKHQAMFGVVFKPIKEALQKASAEIKESKITLLENLLKEEIYKQRLNVLSSADKKNIKKTIKRLIPELKADGTEKKEFADLSSSLSGSLDAAKLVKYYNIAKPLSPETFNPAEAQRPLMIAKLLHVETEELQDFISHSLNAKGQPLVYVDPNTEFYRILSQNCQEFLNKAINNQNAEITDDKLDKKSRAEHIYNALSVLHTNDDHRRRDIIERIEKHLKNPEERYTHPSGVVSMSLLALVVPPMPGPEFRKEYNTFINRNLTNEINRVMEELKSAIPVGTRAEQIYQKIPALQSQDKKGQALILKSINQYLNSFGQQNAIYTHPLKFKSDQFDLLVKRAPKGVRQGRPSASHAPTRKSRAGIMTPSAPRSGNITWEEVKAAFIDAYRGDPDFSRFEYRKLNLQAQKLREDDVENKQIKTEDQLNAYCEKNKRLIYKYTKEQSTVRDKKDIFPATKNEIGNVEARESQKEKDKKQHDAVSEAGASAESKRTQANAPQTPTADAFAQLRTSSIGGSPSAPERGSLGSRRSGASDASLLTPEGSALPQSRARARFLPMPAAPQQTSPLTPGRQGIVPPEQQLGPGEYKSLPGMVPELNGSVPLVPDPGLRITIEDDKRQQVREFSPGKAGMFGEHSPSKKGHVRQLSTVDEGLAVSDVNTLVPLSDRARAKAKRHAPRSPVDFKNFGSKSPSAADGTPSPQSENPSPSATPKFRKGRGDASS